MNDEKELLLSLPLNSKEREWMKERLRTLSVREEYQLAAAVWRSDRLSRLASQDRDERLESVLVTRYSMLRTIKEETEYAEHCCIPH